ncbi:calcium-binding protein [Rhodobacter sp. NSM]|uniref:calcium-binding protein n=1 Tax=Rhodobacter sp. NSM TaxID=3457501 RepID=UPI003FD3E9EC
MSTVNSPYAFRLDEFNLNGMVETLTPEIVNDTATEWTSYRDQFGYGVTYSSFLTFAGTSIGFASGRVTGGTVNAVLFIDDANEAYRPMFTMTGIQLSSTAVVAAVRTASADDDMALFSWALGGADAISMSAGSDYMRGFGGNDVMNGWSGADWLGGDQGNDRLDGGSGDDRLFGGAGRDVLDGGSGADRLVGGAGRDILEGGEDRVRDTFVFNVLSDSRAGTVRDVIHDFVHAIDRIDLSGIDADTTTAGNQHLAFSNSARAHSVWVTDVGEDLVLRADVTGDRAADFEIRLTDVAAFGAGDLLL